MQLRFGLVLVPSCDHADELRRVVDSRLVQPPLDALDRLADLLAVQHVLIDQDDTDAFFPCNIRIVWVEAGFARCQLLDELESLCLVSSEDQVVVKTYGFEDHLESDSFDDLVRDDQNPVVAGELHLEVGRFVHQ